MQPAASFVKEINETLKPSKGKELIHATLSSTPERINALRLTITSLLPQVDTLHVFLQGFKNIPGFLDHKKIYVTQSLEYGDLGEGGKYYWIEDLKGFHFVCSDTVIYPPDYVSFLINKIELHQRRAVLGLGGYLINKPKNSYDFSTEYISELQELKNDSTMQILKDNSIVFHSSTINISKHYFYQSFLSSIWFSIITLEQNVDLVCVAHEANWLKKNLENGRVNQDNREDIYSTFLLKSYFFNYKSNQNFGSDFNSYFDKVFVMNLDRRPDRWKNILRQIKKHNIQAERFSAVDGYKEPLMTQWKEYFSKEIRTLPEGIDSVKNALEKSLNYKHHIARINYIEEKLQRKAVQSPGAFGYALSYIAILKEAIKRDYNRICIFDDDIRFHKNFNKEFKKRINLMPDDWRLLMLGAMQHHWESSWITWENDLMYHCNGTSIASHAVCIDRKTFLPLLFYAEKLDLPIDEGAIFHIQNVYSDKSFVFYPNLIIQDLNDSDINSSVFSKKTEEDQARLYKWNNELYESF